MKREQQAMRHEIVTSNPDVEVRFYLSKDEGSYVSPHWHDSLEIVYVLKGSVTLHLPMGVKTTAREGEFFLVNSGEIHSVLAEKNEALVLQIPQMFCEKFISSMDLFYFSVDMHPKNEIDKTKLDRLKKILMDMYVVYDIRPEGYLLRFNSLLYELLFTLIHSYSHKMLQKEWDRKGKYVAKLKEMLNYINANHAEPISTSDLAERFNYNPDYLTKFFKKYVNCTVTEYIYTVRVSKVQRDLLATDYPVGDILERHGCTNYRLFMRFFKEQWGCTPKQYRKRNKAT